MISKEAFKKGLDKLYTEFNDKGFSMNQPKINQWYEFMKDYTESSFVESIDDYLKNGFRSPAMADIYKKLKSEPVKLRIIIEDRL